jgi:excisionase family DNA binding protein
MEKSNSDILTVEEAAELLKIPRSSVYKLAQEGKIPAKKVGRHWRFHRGVLLRYVAGVPNPDAPILSLEPVIPVETEQSID